MIDETLYRETFSRLRASDEAKKEVLSKMQEKSKRRFPKRLKTGLITAVLTVALAMTANAASGGELMDAIVQKFNIVWSDGFHSVMVDEEGNEWDEYNISAKTELRDGHLYLKAMTQEVDITSELEKSGEVTHTFYKDGYDLTVTVTGTVEDHTIAAVSEQAGLAYSDRRPDVARSDDIVGEDRQGTSFAYDSGDLFWMEGEAGEFEVERNTDLKDEFITTTTVTTDG